jgi:hypothetical protein
MVYSLVRGSAIAVGGIKLAYVEEVLVIQRAAYSLSKTSGTLLVQLLADQYPVDELQIVTYHPGTVYGAGWTRSWNNQGHATLRRRYNRVSLVNDAS